MTRVKTVIGTGLVAALVFTLAQTGFDWGESPRRRELDPDRDRVVRLSAVVNPTRNVQVRWRVGAKNNTVATAGPTWSHVDTARRGDLLVVEITQVITGPYAHCRIEIENVQVRFQKRTDGGRCNVAYVIE